MCIYFKDAFSMIKKIFTLTAVLMLTASSLSGQGFFSVSAGTDGFNMNFGAYQPMRSLLLVPHRHEYNPLLLVPVETPRHYYYDDDDYDDDVVVYPVHHSKKYYKKAAKRYRKALKHARKHSGPSWGVMLTPNGIVVGGSSAPAYYYDYDDDDIEDFYEDMYKHHYKKHHKKHHHKHYRKHHHHDDDDDDDD